MKNGNGKGRTKAKKGTRTASRGASAELNGSLHEVEKEDVDASDGDDEGMGGETPTLPKLTEEEFLAVGKRLFAKKDVLDAKIAGHREAIEKLDAELSEVAMEVFTTLGGIKLEWKGASFTANHRRNGTKDRYHFRNQSAEVRRIG